MALTRATDKIIANADGNLNLSGIVTASSFRGDGSQLTGIDASTLKNGSDTKAQANASGVVVTGVLTATSYSGDGSNLTNLPAGLGTALSSTQTSPLNKLYYTNEILSIGATVTVDHPATGTGAYTQYADIRLEEDADLIIEDGDDVIPDILGLGTDGGGLGAGGSGRIRVDSITNKNANGAPNFPNGLTGTAGTFTGNLNVGGVLTYEDVTNVDSIGIVTARGGIRIGGGTTVGPSSGIVTYFGDGSQLTGISAGAISAIASDGANRVLTSDGDGTATAHSFVTIESNRLSVNRGSGSGAFPLIVRRTDASGIIAEFANSSGYGLLIGQNSATGEAYLRTGTGQPMVFTTNAGSGIANERLRISSEGYVTNPTRPCFDVARSSGAVSSTNAIIFNVENVNNGSHYDSSNGRFTAPVTGTYFLYYGGIKNNTNSVVRLKLLKNGTGNYMNADRELRIDDGDAYGENGSMNVIVSLTATDYVQVYVTQGTIYGTDASYTHFGGYLLS